MENKTKIKNKHYREFMDTGVITFLGQEQIKKALDNVTQRYKLEGRALIIALYYTGARPNEVLRLKGKDITREKSYIKIQIKGSKGGLPRPILVRYKYDMAKELYKFSRGVFPEMYLFYNYQSNYIRKGKVISQKLVEGKIETKVRIINQLELANNLRYYFKKWFKGILEEAIPPYYLRHNRFSKASEAGATDSEIMHLKGSRTIESVRPYKHMSMHAAKKLSKYID